jgi:hypothetical protein
MPSFAREEGVVAVDQDWYSVDDKVWHLPSANEKYKNKNKNKTKTKTL